jgi:hypothetical protein
METKDKRETCRRVIHRMVHKDLSHAFQWFTEAATLQVVYSRQSIYTVGLICRSLTLIE